MSGAGKSSFVWDQNEMWQTLESRFRDVRTAGCSGTAEEIRQRLQEGNRQLAYMAGRQFLPSDHLK